MQIMRLGSEGEDVRSWQHFLVGRGLLQIADGEFGPKTEAATRAYERQRGLDADGRVGPQTWGTAVHDGWDIGFEDPLGGRAGVDWPPPPDFPPLVSNAQRFAAFGQFEYRRVAPDRDDVDILGSWEADNIVKIAIPQLAGVEGAPLSTNVRVHRLMAPRLVELFRLWESDGLLPLVVGWGGAFAARFVRGSTTALSNHAWGAAFDVNAAWNPLGAVPTLRGRMGSVRELVPRAYELGFYWGGHFSRRDGMHFELSRV